jgi:hypothetical protein
MKHLRNKIYSVVELEFGLAIIRDGRILKNQYRDTRYWIYLKKLAITIGSFFNFIYTQLGRLLYRYIYIYYIYIMIKTVNTDYYNSQ